MAQTWLPPTGGAQAWPPPPATGGGSSDAIVENFDGALSLPAGFTTSGDANWFVENTTFRSAPNAAESGDIGDGQTSSLFYINNGLTAIEALSFKLKTETETGFDFLQLFHNGVFITQWSGSTPWTPYILNCAAGLNTFEWRYAKDGSASTPTDAVWIDDVVIA